MRIKNSPYNLRETLGYFKRNYFGPVSKNSEQASYAPRSFELNPGIKPDLRIGLLGDIMDMAGNDLVIGEGVVEFFNNCDFLVGNFEATITTADGPIMAQRHKPQILDALAALSDPRNILLSLANNHSGDFGFDIWSNSRQLIEEKGFQVFGTADKPFIDIDPRLRVVGCTWWSNQPIGYINISDSMPDQIKADAFNMLYPHWGYELELFPRPLTVRAGESWLLDYDVVIGHHSHTPQPISIAADRSRKGARQLIAYGLGDFCIREELEHYLFGEVLKVEIGDAGDGNLCIGKVDWQFTTCRRQTESLWKTELTNRFPYLEV